MKVRDGEANSNITASSGSPVARAEIVAELGTRTRPRGEGDDRSKHDPCPRTPIYTQPSEPTSADRPAKDRERKVRIDKDRAGQDKNKKLTAVLRSRADVELK